MATDLNGARISASANFLLPATQKMLRLVTRCLRLIAAMVWLTLPAAMLGCSSAQRVTDVHGYLTAVDLTDARADKRALVVAISLLGRSLEDDLEILHKITGVRLVPKPLPGSFPPGESRHFAFAADFAAAPMLISSRFGYRTDASGRYTSSTNFVFAEPTVCISVDDLKAALGVPTEVITKPDSPHFRGKGPSDVWYVTYNHASRSRTVFVFSTALCANGAVHGPAPTTKANRP
jgi:hypothetical protein